MDKIRMIKEPDEIRKLREVASLTDDTMENVIPMIREGISMRELSLEIEFAGRKSGASDVSFPPVGGFIKSGSVPNGSIYSYKLDQGLKSKTTVFFDVGFVLDGYCSDWGRSIYYGNPNNEIKGGYYSLQQAVVETVDEMHEGSMKVSEVFNHIEASLDKEGYGDYLRARLPNRSVGHQIGVEVHEPPWLRPDFDDLLQEGMIMCLEPKLWHDGEYYFRVEDMILIHKNKAEFLTSFDRELFEI
jgi:Xaa-Pro aminopeptidase